MSTPDDFDIGPLTWVKSEIDQALERSLTALRAYAANPGDSNQIRFSQTHFHQAHGALQIVGLDGVTRLSEELDGLLGDIAKSGGAPAPEAVSAAKHAFGAITAYLDQLLVGEPNQPLRLFAVYRDVAKLRGREGVDPVDLYYPDLTRRPPRREKPPVDVPAGQGQQYYRDQRGRYQRGLLKWLKKDWTGVEDMRAAVAAVEAAQTNPASRAFWWVALGFFDALFAKAIADQATVARLANRVEQQLKRLMEGSATVAERLMREALFAVARARPATEHVRNVQEVFQLSGSVPAAFELKSENSPQFPALRALREAVGGAKTAWNKVASGHQPSIATFRDLAVQMRDRAAELKQPELAKIADEVATLAAWVGDGPSRLTDGVAMETATALLLIENAVDNFATLGAEFAQQANLMHRRLQAVVKGEAPHASQPVPVLDEMSRRAQERLLMAQVVSEIQASLRAIEQALDAFFRDAAKRGELASLDKPVRQVLGALTMLNEDRAAAALSQCAAEIQRFAQAGYAPAQGDFERVAGTLSGLGFYVDALQHGKADFDQFMRPIAARKIEVVEQAEEQTAGGTVEAELEKGKKELNAIYERWKREPQNSSVKEELRGKATAMQKDAGLVADAKLELQAADMLRILDATDAKPFDPKVSQVLTAIQPAAPAAPSPEAQKFIAASAETVDAELLSVYLEEAGEVLGTIGENLGQARELPQNIELLRTIRRGFHTLKGSGRMVGLTRLGEAAWAVEQVMNRWLEEERAATPDLFTLIGTARQFFEGAVASLKAGGSSPDESATVAMANKVKAGEALGEIPAEIAAVPPAVFAPEAPQVVEAPALLQEIDLAAIAPAPEPETVTPVPVAPVEIAPALAPVEELPAIALPAVELPAIEPVAAPAPEADETITIGDVQLSQSLYVIFLEETRAHLDALAAGRQRLDEGEHVTEDFERAAHTLAGIAGTVKVDAVKDIGHALEGLLERLLDKPADPAARALIGEAIDNLNGMLDKAAARQLPAAMPALIARLDAMATAEEGGAAPALDFAGAPAPADTLTPSPAFDDLDFALPATTPQQTETPPAARARVALDFSDFSLPAPMGEPAVTAIAPVAANDTVVAPPHVPPAPPPARPEVVAAPGPQPAPAETHLPAVEVEENPMDRRTRRLDDDIDQDLLPIFLEEAQELVPAVGQGLRDWRVTPGNMAAGNALQRTLHTLKGSARMCGAMALGELTHHMETRVENALATPELPATFFEELEGSYDRMGLLYDRLVNPQAAVPASMGEPASAAAAPAAAAPQAEAVPQKPAAPAPEKPAAPAPEKAEEKPATQIEQDLAAASRAMLRVRADLIDRLVNEAGEVSIARSRIEGDLRAIKGALFEFTENVNRMRSQLRDIEIQAESQMQSRISLAQESETPFDPLEFDRFTRFQELTRMMAESVNDVATVHQNLLKAVGESEAATSAQARLTRALQANLMRIRMVPFASVSERLFRIVRQAAKETEKRAVLDIKGGQVEVDRSVLERITAPFEHMLRNSVVHGIEAPAERIAKGKPELGEVRIDVRQEGNEIVLSVVDDGAGLNFARIRAKALSQGLLKPEDNPTDGEIAEFIFHPGFSTAQEVTQLAGRGVGMDVVKSEIAALGGRVDLASENGKGTRLTIYLPLTLAVTQAVLVRAGNVAYAIPAVMVEQVRQVKAPELESYRAAGETSWQDRRYPFRYLPRLLGDAEFVPEQKRVTPVLLLRTGGNTVALQVDEVAGSQEIVVKNTGPLLARVAGITGATVLGNGEIVLILNPVILAARELTVSVRLPAAPAEAKAEASAVPTIMIVDDSLTVRKITGRLLAREGYNVLTAKDGVDAMEQLQEHLPGVMLVDIEMPRMDGFDLTRNVRADSRLKHVPIIMITSRTAEKHRSYAKEIGVNVYLGKPYQEDELLRHIGGFVKKAALV
ncbi:MAG TPA: Hpt domain-containing protein [Burkholderiales bacterium]|nr:Hpt domain-containing protein [Burkholderiales bacterium]